MPVNVEKTNAFADLVKSFISASDARDRMGSALREHLAVEPKDCFWICDDGVTEDGPVAIYCLERGTESGSLKGMPCGPGEYFRIGFKLEAGKYTFGEPVKVRRKTDYEAVPEAGVQKSMTQAAPAAPEKVLVPRKLGASLTPEERDFAKSLQASHIAAAEAQPDAGAAAAHREAADLYEGASRTLDTPAFRAAMGQAGALAGLIKSWSGIPDQQRRPFGEFRKSMAHPVQARPFTFTASNGNGDALGHMPAVVAGSRPAVETPTAIAPEPTTYSAQRGAVNGLRKSMGAFYGQLAAGASQARLDVRFPKEALLAKSEGPFVGPRGGEWADAAHTIPWKEPGASGPSPEDHDAVADEHDKKAAHHLAAAVGKRYDDPHAQAGTAHIYAATAHRTAARAARDGMADPRNDANATAASERAAKATKTSGDPPVPAVPDKDKLLAQAEAHDKKAEEHKAKARTAMGARVEEDGFHSVENVRRNLRDGADEHNNAAGAHRDAAAGFRAAAEGHPYAMASARTQAARAEAHASNAEKQIAPYAQHLKG